MTQRGYSPMNAVGYDK